MTEKRKKNSKENYHHGDLRTALIAKARAIVESDGPNAVSLRGVAKAAGVSQAAPYHHFKDKHSLLAAVAAEGFDELTNCMTERAHAQSKPIDQLRALGAGYAAYAVANPSLFKLMQGPIFQGENVDDALRKAREASAAPLVAAVSACLPGASQKQIMTACAAAWSLVHGMATLIADGRLKTLIDTDDVNAAADQITRHLAIEACLEIADD